MGQAAFNTTTNLEKEALGTCPQFVFLLKWTYMKSKLQLESVKSLPTQYSPIIHVTNHTRYLKFFTTRVVVIKILECLK